ncbi:MAG: GAF domain-containing protein [Chloroflexi bacterium]|nr:GAF domain-containing protein [Chloroflexota bacterium]
MSPQADTERKLRELSFLHEVTGLASSTRDWDEMLRLIIDRTTHAMRAEVAALYLLERREGILRLVATNGLNRRGIGRVTLRVGEGITGWVANAHVPLVVRDVRMDPRWKRIPTVDDERFTSMLSVPLVLHDQVVGVLNIQTVELREFDRAEIDFLQTIANQVSGIIEKSRLQRDAERKLHEVSALFEVSNVLTSTLDLGEVLGLVVDRLVRVYPGASGAILLRSGTSGDEGFAARSGELGKAAVQAARVALAEKRPIVEADHIALPLLAGDKLLGAVVLQVPGRGELIDQEIAFVGAIANQAALAIDKASLYERERETARSLRELERARSDFVTVVTHDLRTPLSVIHGYLELLGEGAKDGQVQATTAAVEQVVRLDHLVDRILAGVRGDSLEMSVKSARFDVRSTLAGAAGELRAIARRHRLTPPRSGAPLWVRGDRRRTVEIVGGLVENATKYAPPGTRIAISASRARDRAVVRVADQGPGVPPPDRTRIFEPYVRVGDPSRVPGSGIGLYASRHFVEAQGGDLWYEDSETGGAVFAFSLPLSGSSS